AAGLLAAGECARRGRRTALVERNERLGRKLMITGKGRCNLTNNADLETVLKNIPRNPRFLYGALSRFLPEDVMNFFEEEGVPLKTERGDRVFPVSDRAADVADALVRRAKRYGVAILHARAEEILTEGCAVIGVKTDGGDLFAERVILATGGLSYPGTGSTGDGYRMAGRLGHTLVPPKPSLVPLETREDCAPLAGLSLRNVTLSVRDNERGKVVFSELGEMLFTHFGVSGPLVLSASARMEKFGEGRYTLSIDLKPGLTAERLDARLQRDFAERKNCQTANALRKLLPAKLIPPVLERSSLSPEKQCNAVTRAERLALGRTVKAFSLAPTRFRPIAEAIVTDGGIDVREISPKTMESKLVKGLYFAGEIIDVAGFTGGFNLQIAFSTGYCAALSASEDG
ncbi:MAG: NAD(P)/FAD-dependent oxidoreductase, partial [Bacteroides sp.]|nr:NAD(P)/FAD-dependent oxidoreductase [Bacteroides sp.]